MQGTRILSINAGYWFYILHICWYLLGCLLLPFLWISYNNASNICWSTIILLKLNQSSYIQRFSSQKLLSFEKLWTDTVTVKWTRPFGYIEKYRNKYWSFGNHWNNVFETTISIIDMNTLFLIFENIGCYFFNQITRNTTKSLWHII